MSLKEACVICTLLILGSFYAVTCQDQAYSADSNVPIIFQSSDKLNVTDSTRFLIYEVNPGEGFNLRRDVYVRVANLIKYLNDHGENWVLVLPPWRHLYHWKSRYLQQESISWGNFFDLANMNLYIPVMEFEEFLKVTGSNAIDYVLYLQRHSDQFKNGWKELIDIEKCTEKSQYHKDKDIFKGYFWGLDVVAKNFDCVSVQGHSTILADFLKKIKARSVFIERFEQVLHVNYGSVDFYEARRSLVFAKHLRKVGDKFRSKFLDSDDNKDKTPYNEDDWRNQVPTANSAFGGPYIGVHVRRADFVFAHKETIPSIKEIGKEIKQQLKKHSLNKIYVSTDASEEEIKELKSYLSANVYQFPRPKDIVRKYKDGGVAIVDQWIVSHARYFIGTCLSTFSFRIYEERDILGFNEDTTYNCLCGKQSPKDRCEKPSRWRVKFQ